MDIKPAEKKTPRSFTLKPSSIAIVEEYADLKGTNASQVIETMITHFLPKIIEQEKRKDVPHETL